MACGWPHMSVWPKRCCSKSERPPPSVMYPYATRKTTHNSQTLYTRDRQSLRRTHLLRVGVRVRGGIGVRVSGQGQGNGQSRGQGPP